MHRLSEAVEYSGLTREAKGWWGDGGQDISEGGEGRKRGTVKKIEEGRKEQI